MAHRHRIRWLLTLVLVAQAACAPPPQTVHRLEGSAQGTTYSLQWRGALDVSTAASAAELELKRIDALLSTYRSDSLLEQFNAARTSAPYELTVEIVALLQLAQRVHAASAGCFDPTVRPLVRAWGFDGDTPAEPEAAALARARLAVGLDKIEIVDDRRVRKLVPEVELDMSSIGQGYTAARLAALLEELGARDYLAELGGEIVARGTRADGTGWRIGVEDPTGNAPPLALVAPTSSTLAVVTSGTYRQFIESDGRRLSHILDARTGRPVAHDLLAVTVVAEDGAQAAAWGTALLCLGPEEAPVVADREGIAALWWIKTGEHEAARTASGALAARWPELAN